jgi:hypothetical protein
MSYFSVRLGKVGRLDHFIVSGLLTFVAAFGDGCSSYSHSSNISEFSDQEQLNSTPPEGGESTDGYIAFVKEDGILRAVQQNGREVFSVATVSSWRANYLISGHHLCYLDSIGDFHVIDLRQGSEIFRTRDGQTSGVRRVHSFKMVGTSLAWLEESAGLHLVDILTERETDFSTVLPANSWQVRTFQLSPTGIIGTAEPVTGGGANRVTGSRYFALNPDGRPYSVLNMLEGFLGGSPTGLSGTLQRSSFFGPGAVIHVSNSTFRGGLSLRDFQGSLVWSSQVDTMAYLTSNRILAYHESPSMSLRAVRIVPTELGQGSTLELHPIRFNGSEFISPCDSFAVSDHRIACVNGQRQLLVFDEIGNPIPHLQGSVTARRVRLSNHFIAHQLGEELVVRNLNGQEIFREDRVVSFSIESF